MSNIKRYEVEYDDKGEMTIEVDHDKVTDKELHEINDFWSDAEYRLSSNNGNILQTVLKLIAQQAFNVAFINCYNVRGVVSAFDWQEEGQEGFPPMDGSEGFKITHIDIHLLDKDDMYVKEIKA